MRGKMERKKLISLSLITLLSLTLIISYQVEAQASNPDTQHLVGEWSTELKFNSVDFSQPSIFTKESFFKRNGEKETVKISQAGDNLLVSVGSAGDIQNTLHTYRDGKYTYTKIFGESPGSIDQLITELTVLKTGNKFGFTLNVVREVRAPDHYMVLDFSYKNTEDKVIESPIVIETPQTQRSLSEIATDLWESLKEALAGESFQVKTPDATCGVRG